MEGYEKPYLTPEIIEINDICVESGDTTNDGVTVDFPKAGA